MKLDGEEVQSPQKNSKNASEGVGRQCRETNEEILTNGPSDIIPVPKFQNLIFPVIEKLFEAPVFDVAVAKALVPSSSMPRKHCVVPWRQ
jgi:hypothetical protein